MSINDEFYSNFPSLNSNSKENQRYKRISREYENYLKNVSPKSPPKSITQQRKIRSKQQQSEESSPISSSSPNPRMDVIFSAEDRNRFEDEQVKNRKKLYQEILQNQIEEQRTRKKLDIERRKREEIILEERLQRQLESIKLQRDPPLAEKIVERVSLSENEKDSYNDSKLSKHNTSTSSNNDVYRYFSKSAKPDFDLYNYRRYFTDVVHEQRQENPLDLDFPATRKAIKNNELALRKVDTKKKPEIDSCPSCSPPECSRCHKKLEIYCNACTDHVEKPSPEVPKRLQIEYDEPELPFANQQVVIYRAADQHAPYSFNIEPESLFGEDKLEDIQRETEKKLANYLKNYGSLKKKKLPQEALLKEVEAQPVYTGTIPKWKPLIQDNSPPKNLTFTPASDNSQLDEALNNAQYKVITQIGWAKRQLELEKVKS